MSLVFRKSTPDDALAILKLVRSAYRGDESRAGWTTEADLVADERIDEAGMLNKINQPQGLVLLAYDASGSLVACCELLRRDDQVAYFGLFAVSPLRQSAGFGRQVLQRAEQWARDAWGSVRIEMSVIWTRTELISWYQRRGYTRTGEKLPFPYDQLVGGHALRDDLYFEVLAKQL